MLINKYFFLLICVLILSTKITFAQAETEPNNAPEQANLLTLNGSGSGTLTNSTDAIDWWKVIVPSDGKLVIATQSDAALEIDNSIYDQDKLTQIASYAYGGTHTWDTTYFNNLVAGTYYIRTYDYSGNGAYTITSNFIPAKYQIDYEPNDSAQASITLDLNGSSAGHLGYYGLGKYDSQDWWQVTVPSDGKLVIATLSDETVEIDNYIYDKDKKTQIASYAYGGSHTWDTTYFNNLVPGTYYIRTYCYNGYGAYTITNNFIPAKYDNDVEPNDSVAIATVFPTNGNSTGHLGFYSLGNSDISDWRQIVVPFDGKLVVATSSDATLEIDNYIYDQDKLTQIASYAYGGSHIWDTTYFNNLTPGIYYIKSYCYGGYGAYTITNNFIPTRNQNDLEPNDSIQVAKNVDLKTIMPGHLGFYGNKLTDLNDCFMFTVSSVWDTLFIRTDTDLTLDVDLFLFNAAGEQIIYSGGSGTTELLIQPNIQPGNYYIRVTRWSGYGSYALFITDVRPSDPLLEIKDESLSILPDTYDLLQNYPNPFNPITSINYSLPVNSFVVLKVFNILGQEITTLVNEEKPSGKYTIKFDASTLSSGIYFLRMEAGNFNSSVKMILMK